MELRSVKTCRFDGSAAPSVAPSTLKITEKVWLDGSRIPALLHCAAALRCCASGVPNAWLRSRRMHFKPSVLGGHLSSGALLWPYASAGGRPWACSAPWCASKMRSSRQQCRSWSHLLHCNNTPTAAEGGSEEGCSAGQCRQHAGAAACRPVGSVCPLPLQSRRSSQLPGVAAPVHAAVGSYTGD